MNTSLHDLFLSLKRPVTESDGSRVFAVAKILDRDGAFVGCSSDGHAVIVLEMDLFEQTRAPIVLQRLRVAFDAQCELILENKARRCRVTTIECICDEPILKQYFFLIADQILKKLGHRPDPDGIVLSIDSLVSLFQRAFQPPIKDAQGLFGELAFIESANDPASMISGWRSDQFNRFDFAIDDFRVEVKTSQTRQRRHQFSLEQCVLPASVRGLVVSLFVEETGGGLSLGALIARIESRISEQTELVFRLHNVVAQTLGAALPLALSKCFDEQLAISSIAFFDVSLVPAIRELPAGVSSVRFTSDLSRAQEIKPDADDPTWTGIFATYLG